MLYFANKVTLQINITKKNDKTVEVKKNNNTKECKK